MVNLNPTISQGLITAGGGLAGSIINGALGIWQANKDRQFNAEQAELNRVFQRDERLAAQEFDLDMWNLNNEYNDIGSQIERARAAGVNPMALLGGDYKSAQSSPVTTSPQSGAPASSSAGGAVGSALINSTAPLLATAVGGVKQLADAKVANETLPLVKAELQSRVEVNFATVQKFAHENGLTDVKRDEVVKTIQWMDGLNQAEISRRLAAATRDYNENYAIFQQIAESKNRMKNDDARVDIERDVADSQIAVDKATISHTDSLTAYQFKVNANADDMLKAQLTQEEVAAWEAEKRKEFANDYNLVLGTSEFEFAWQLHCKGMYEEYCDKVIHQSTKASMKPIDWRAPAGTYSSGWNWRTGVLNPVWKGSETEYNFLKKNNDATFWNAFRPR